MKTPKIEPDDIKEARDGNLDLTLRPQTWEEYVGQDKVKKNLKVIIDAAKKRHET